MVKYGSVNNVSNPTANENTANIQTLEGCSNEKVDREMGNFVDTVEDRIQNEILTAMDNNITTRINLAVRSKNVSSGRDAASVTANSECGERIGITASFENVSERNNTFHELNANDGTRGNIPVEVSELSVPRTHFNWKPFTNHSGSYFLPESSNCFKSLDILTSTDLNFYQFLHFSNQFSVQLLLGFHCTPTPENL